MIYLIITPFFPDNESFRGPYVYDQVKAIMATGKYSQVVVCKPAPFYIGECNDYTYQGIDVYRFKTYDIPSAILPGAFNQLSIASFFKMLKRIGVKLDDIAVAHSHVAQLGVYANTLKKRNKNIYTIIQHHGFDVLSLENGRFAKYNWHCKYVKNYGIKICNRADLNVGVSSKTLSYLTAYKGLNPKDTYTLYNGVDMAKFHQTDTPKDPSIFKIGCIANFWALKDQITLIKAVEILVKTQPNIYVEFIGSGVTLDSCKEYIEKNNLQSYFNFKPEIDHTGLIEFYNTLNLFVLPSYYEAFGCVYTEAYACGVPFIGVKGQGIAEIIPAKDADKWLIDKGDFVSLANIVNNYIAYRYTQHLSIDINIYSTINNFIEYINQK